jgi:hypothetical protein
MDWMTSLLDILWEVSMQLKLMLVNMLEIRLETDCPPSARSRSLGGGFQNLIRTEVALVEPPHFWLPPNAVILTGSPPSLMKVKQTS